MPELVEQMYCSQQIVIPPKFPYILKRYCKAAIKTQPYDLLRWSHEYFKALAQRRPPPVKLRLEYPVYSTEGGLTRGCLKVLANQLSGMEEIPLPVLKSAWQGFCLDGQELQRILCLCEVYLRAESVPFLHFMAVAGGLLTKTLTHTMILLCETLTKEPDGGSAAIPVEHFLGMYGFLAKMDASQDIKYVDGYREGTSPKDETSYMEEEEVKASSEESTPEQLRALNPANVTDEAPKESVIAGRQMSTTSAEFVVKHFEKGIMEYVDEQIGILPDPDLKKKKAKPEEVAMVRNLLETFLDENMDVIVPEVEEVEEEEPPLPDITLVYAVPGIGAPVEMEITTEFENYALEVSKLQSHLFMPRNIRHFLCPPLEKYVEHNYAEFETKEEVPTEGTIVE